MTRNEHIDLERLSDFVDDRLLGDDRAAVQDHLANCLSCASHLARLQSLLEAAHALPDEIEPPPARSIDAGYAVAIRQLDEALAQRRAELDPATIAKVEASLNVIDVAIAEARRALADDPANRTLLDILAANYEHKVELLRRANELLPRT